MVLLGPSQFFSNSLLKMKITKENMAAMIRSGEKEMHFGNA